uniref:Putative ticsk ixostatin n=1 Tax=Ixodes ricinus TaxID=34613 RepID=A0A147BFH5_IXORI
MSHLNHQKIMLVENFVLFIICLLITLRGAGSQEIRIQHRISTITLKCNETFMNLCLKPPVPPKGQLKKIDLDFPMCGLTCLYEVTPGKWDGTRLQLPNGLPCEYGRVCKDGTCIEDVCK